MISLAMAVYNGYEYIEKQLMSIVGQTLPPDEIVITDDSDDTKTYDIIKEFIDRYNSINWIYIKNDSRLGYCKNFFKAISLTSGDIVFLSDQDDIWSTDKIKKMSICMRDDNNIKCLCSKYRCIDKDDNIISDIYEYSTSYSYKKRIKRDKYFKLNKNEYFKILAFPGFCFAFTNDLRDELSEFIRNFDSGKVKYHDLVVSFLSARKDSFYIYNEALNMYRMHGHNAIGIEDYNRGKKQDRIEWLYNIYNNQNYLLSYEKAILSNSHENDNSNINILHRFIEFNYNRIKCLKNRDFFKTIKSFFSIGDYLSLKSYIGDILYLLK